MSRAARPIGDVAGLPDYAFGPTSVGWWGVIGFVLIEGMGFVLAIGAYYYLLQNEVRWPPDASPPPLGWATAFVLTGLCSEVPNYLVGRMAKAQRLHAVRWGLVLMVLLGLLMLALRGFELHALNVRWDRNAYGSIVWALLVLHTFHAITDVFDSMVLAALSWCKHMDGRRYADVADNALYWHFIVWSGAGLYLVIYWTPRWL